MTRTVSSDVSAPTDQWLAALPVLAPLTGPAGTAERLLMLIHYGIDWPDSWVSRYRSTYWSTLLPDRVLKATYRANTLRSWWTQVSTDLDSAPRTPAERTEAAALLQADAKPVLHILRDQTPALLLRVRLVADAVRDRRAAQRNLNRPADEPLTDPHARPLTGAHLGAHLDAHPDASGDPTPPLVPVTAVR